MEERLKSLGGFDTIMVPTTNTDDQTHQALINAFHQAHWNAMNNPEIKTGRNGATCIVCLLEKNSSNKDHIQGHVAYVGDSRAIVISKLGDIQTIAPETTVDMLHERKRIERQEGSIRGDNVFYGPVGIAMTRALGDAVMLRAGVVPTPMVDTFSIGSGEVVILATDGIWGVLNNTHVLDIVQKHKKRPRDAAEAIAEQAKERWVGDLPIQDEVKMDDITVMVVCVD